MRVRQLVTLSLGGGRELCESMPSPVYVVSIRPYIVRPWWEGTDEGEKRKKVDDHSALEAW